LGVLTARVSSTEASLEKVSSDMSQLQSQCGKLDVQLMSQREIGGTHEQQALHEMSRMTGDMESERKERNEALSTFRRLADDAFKAIKHIEQVEQRIYEAVSQRFTSRIEDMNSMIRVTQQDLERRVASAEELFHCTLTELYSQMKDQSKTIEEDKCLTHRIDLLETQFKQHSGVVTSFASCMTALEADTLRALSVGKKEVSSCRTAGTVNLPIGSTSLAQNSQHTQTDTIDTPSASTLQKLKSQLAPAGDSTQTHADDLKEKDKMLPLIATRGVLTNSRERMQLTIIINNSTNTLQIIES